MNKKTNKGISVLMFILCVSIVFTGCQKDNVSKKLEFTFSEEDFNKLLLDMGQLVKEDIKRMEDSYGVDKKNEEMNEDPLIQRFRFYNNSDLNKEQREKLDVALKLNLDKSLYLLTPNDKKTRDKLFETSLRYIKLVDDNYSIVELLYTR